MPKGSPSARDRLSRRRAWLATSLHGSTRLSVLAVLCLDFSFSLFHQSIAVLKALRRFMHLLSRAQFPRDAHTPWRVPRGGSACAQGWGRGRRLWDQGERGILVGGTEPKFHSSVQQISVVVPHFYVNINHNLGSSDTRSLLSKLNNLMHKDTAGFGTLLHCFSY